MARKYEAVDSGRRSAKLFAGTLISPLITYLQQREIRFRNRIPNRHCGGSFGNFVLG